MRVCGGVSDIHLQTGRSMRCEDGRRDMLTRPKQVLFRRYDFVRGKAKILRISILRLLTRLGSYGRDCVDRLARRKTYRNESAAMSMSPSPPP